MQEEKKAFLPYFFTETIYSVKNEKGAINKQAHNPQPKSDKADHNGHLIQDIDEILTKPKSVDPTPALPQLPYSGKNLKKVLVLFENKMNNQLEEGEKIFFGKILQAVQLNFDDVALLNLSLVEESAFDQINSFDALVQISLGVKDNCLTFNADMPSYEIVNKNNVSYLLTDSLKQIQAEKAKKVLLWNNLQKLFARP